MMRCVRFAFFAWSAAADRLKHDAVRQCAGGHDGAGVGPEGATNRKSGDSPAVSASYSIEEPKPESAYRGDWTDEELAAVEDFLSEHMPEILEDWERNGDIPDWLPQTTLDAGLGAEPEEVLCFLHAKIDSGWIPLWWRSYPP
jgi:hypothetical protein